jgi:hypothetical protein
LAHPALRLAEVPRQTQELNKTAYDFLEQNEFRSKMEETAFSYFSREQAKHMTE